MSNAFPGNPFPGLRERAEMSHGFATMNGEGRDSPWLAPWTAVASAACRLAGFNSLEHPN